MQVTTPEAITEKIAVQIIPKLMSTIPQWTNRAEIKKFVRTAVISLIDVAGLDDLAQKQQREPQSEREDTTQNSAFKKELIKQADKFTDALHNFGLVLDADL